MPITSLQVVSLSLVGPAKALVLAFLLELGDMSGFGGGPHADMEHRSIRRPGCISPQLNRAPCALWPITSS